MIRKIARKQVIIAIRMAVSLGVGIFVLFQTPQPAYGLFWGYAWLLTLLVTLVITACLPAPLFEPGRFLEAVVVFDTVLLAAGMAVTGLADSDLYLLFFLVLCAAALCSRYLLFLFTAGIFAVLYSGLLYLQGCPEVQGSFHCFVRPALILIAAGAFGIVNALMLGEQKQRQFDARQRYERLFAASDVMVYTVGLLGEYLSANPKLYEAYGFKSELEMLGLLYADFHDADETAAFQAHVDRVFTDGSPVQYESYDKRVEQWLSHTLSPIYDAGKNQVFAVAGVSKDITERVRKEQELTQAYETLRETRDQLIQKDKMAALGRVASGVAHEIRNPLEIISMGVDYLENILPKDNPRAAQSVEKINQAIDRANFIIDDVLKFSRKTEITISPTDICEAVKEALSLSGHHLQKSGVGVNRDFPQTPLWVAGNRNMLIQVMLNLINNAVDAMADSEVKQLEIRISEVAVDRVGYKIGYRRADYFKMGESMVMVEISDTGRGMDQDVLGKIFEPFFSTRASGGGTGLGLSLAHMIMDRMMGTIDVTSRPKAGSAFYVKLQPAENIYLMEGQADG